MFTGDQLQGLGETELRALAQGLLKEINDRDAVIAGKDAEIAQRLAQIAHTDSEMLVKDRKLVWSEARIDQLTHEIAVLKRWKFSARSEQLDATQKSLLDESIEADIAAIELELEQLRPAAASNDAPRHPKRAPLPANLPRTEHRHEPASTTCACGCALKRIGQDVSEKLDYTPGVFTVERHIRGKWACARCETLVQAPVPAQVIDKGIPTAGLLAQVLVAKYADHLPLYRQESIFARAGMALSRSTLAEWVGACGVQLQPLVDALKDEMLRHSVLHADETPVAMLAPGKKKTHRAYLWAYCPGVFEDLRAVVYDFAPSRAGEHARAFLQQDNQPWRGKLVCDDFSGYKASFAQGVTEVGCAAHARRKFYELHANTGSAVAEQALRFFGELYEIEREARTLDTSQRLRLRQEKARPLADSLHAWMLAQRLRATDGTGLARALDYSLKRWAALTRYIDDGQLPIDNNWVENQIRPIALGRSNWLFAGSLRAGQRAAAVMSLIQSAKLNGLDPHAYLKDVLQRLPTHKARLAGELLPHRWQPLPSAH
ncbi:IS66 family transposase [Delftia tsuruhatensis]|uniref:IS66 family transposase n=1 Tax=Delftia tsuruhatensis TaxID=180282 RepID=A0ABM6ECI6_9BURK|nr:IS66 family transposase [Delftia tsuruhatensis]AOV05341.1 IS66 family transposase [Delftia tsuruhatensis]